MKDILILLGSIIAAVFCIASAVILAYLFFPLLILAIVALVIYLFVKSRFETNVEKHNYFDEIIEALKKEKK